GAREKVRLRSSPRPEPPGIPPERSAPSRGAAPPSTPEPGPPKDGRRRSPRGSPASPGTESASSWTRLQVPNRAAKPFDRGQSFDHAGSGRRPARIENQRGRAADRGKVVRGAELDADPVPELAFDLRQDVLPELFAESALLLGVDENPD